MHGNGQAVALIIHIWITQHYSKLCIKPCSLKLQTLELMLETRCAMKKGFLFAPHQQQSRCNLVFIDNLKPDLLKVIHTFQHFQPTSKNVVNTLSLPRNKSTTLSFLKCSQLIGSYAKLARFARISSLDPENKSPVSHNQYS